MDTMSNRGYEGVDTPDGDLPPAVKQQGDLVIDKFNSLFGRCDPLNEEHRRNGPMPIENNAFINQLKSGPLSIEDNALLNRLKSTSDRLESNLLPLLGDQLIAISLSLKPSELQREPSSNLKRILEMQEELEQTLCQIRSALDLLPEQEVVPNQTNDQHHKEFKNYRINGLDQCIRDEVLMEMAGFFSSSIMLVRQLGFSTDPRINHMVPAGMEVVHTRYRSEASLKSAIIWLKGSEWDTVLVGWRLAMDVIDSVLEKSIRHISSIPNHDLNNRPPFEPLGERNLQVAESLIPIIKLSRIFLARLSKLEKKNKTLPHYTEMCTHQLQSLHDLPLCAISKLSCLQSMSVRNDMFDEASTIRFNDMVRRLLALFQSSLLDVVLCVIPLVPDVNGFPYQTYLKTWFVTWNTQFIIATQNITRLTFSFLNNPL
ncbi:uncharacterized protein PGTG_00614 [Puccinia graminis f. sp. tritici CRL 75-36-700-3]|uniref:Uncharacterized protein n=1 Tax=Puccinia graminis f. sp. tritici (strain CRL 75-36-700-3 / race SCCL) TaxID=418459 RepID=E3JQC9_PUCGT|nr:uncharacterized protein PGTG_00614 [Puccinia graminis f. sp. tritici CRL 75-36-700-3]EFP74658.1 hypothetical protein PGTG_00614 [Puccinia graminis f. sp. tritici CRL 75-36-700-3]